MADAFGASRSRPAGGDPCGALPARLRDLHARAAAGDRAAHEALAELLLPRVRRQLRRLRGARLADAAHDAVVDAFLQVPLRTEGAAASWENYERLLLLAASRNVLDALRHAMRQAEWEGQYHEQHGANPYAAISADPRATFEYERFLAALVTTPAEREAIVLWLQGERHRPTLAAALGWAHLSRAERDRAVKQCTDRWTKRLRKLLASEGRGRLCGLL